MFDSLSTTWHSFPAITLESELMRVVMIPELGAKIVSLFDKAHQREWLVPPVRPLQHAAYGATFIDQDMSGWDEMMPTINACRWGGKYLPDHGEVWSIPWQVETTGTTVVLSVAGLALPYRLTRLAALTAPDCLELRYILTNTSPTAFPYIWAAHPQFAVDGQTRLVMPPEVTQVVNVIANDPVWGQEGQLHDWPNASGADGNHWQLDRVRGAEHHTCRKFYVPPAHPAAWAALVQEGPRACQLRLDWQPDELPYLGLWIDEGMYNTQPVAAFEPSNGYYDNLESALQNERAGLLLPGRDQTWSLRIRLSA